MAWRRARTVFHGFRLDDAGIEAEIRRLYEATGYLADPHTAVGIAGARALPPAPADRHGGGGDRASCQVSRCDRASGRLAAAAAASPGRPVRPGGAVPGPAERTARGRGRGAGAHPPQHAVRHCPGRDCCSTGVRRSAGSLFGRVRRWAVLCACGVRPVRPRLSAAPGRRSPTNRRKG